MSIFSTIWCKRPPWRDYVTVFRDKLDKWAVWWPGDYFEVGDFGICKMNRFIKTGSIRELTEISDEDLRTQPISLNTIEFGGFRGFDSKTKTETSIPEVGSVSIELDLGSSRGIFLRACNLSRTTFKSMTFLRHKIAKALLENRFTWNPEWFLVDEVISAQDFMLICSSSANTSIRISGSIEAIENLKLGKVGNWNSFSIDGQIALKMDGKSGPLAMSLRALDIPDLTALGAGEIDLESQIEMRAVPPRSVEWEKFNDD